MTQAFKPGGAGAGPPGFRHNDFEWCPVHGLGYTCRCGYAICRAHARAAERKLVYASTFMVAFGLGTLAGLVLG